MLAWEFLFTRPVTVHCIEIAIKTSELQRRYNDSKRTGRYTKKQVTDMVSEKGIFFFGNIGCL